MENRFRITFFFFRVARVYILNIIIARAERRRKKKKKIYENRNEKKYHDNLLGILRRRDGYNIILYDLMMIHFRGEKNRRIDSDRVEENDKYNLACTAYNTYDEALQRDNNGTEIARRGRRRSSTATISRVHHIIIITMSLHSS